MDKVTLSLASLLIKKQGREGYPKVVVALQAICQIERSMRLLRLLRSRTAALRLRVWPSGEHLTGSMWGTACCWQLQHSSAHSMFMLVSQVLHLPSWVQLQYTCSAKCLARPSWKLHGCTLKKASAHNHCMYCKLHGHRRTAMFSAVALAKLSNDLF